MRGVLGAGLGGCAPDPLGPGRLVLKRRTVLVDACGDQTADQASASILRVSPSSCGSTFV